MAYGDSEEAAMRKVKAIALPVLADMIEIRRRNSRSV